MSIPIEIPTRLFVDTDMFIATFIPIGTGPRISIIILKKKNEVGEIAPSDFKAPVAAKLETVCCWDKWTPRSTEENRDQNVKRKTV